MIFNLFNSILNYWEGNFIIKKILFFILAIRDLLFYLSHYYVKHYFLNAPRNLFGYAGSDYFDICKEITSVSSSHWIENKEQCEITIDKHIASYTTALLMIVVPYLIFYFITTFKFFTGKDSPLRKRNIADKDKSNLQRKQTESLKVISKRYVEFLANISQCELNENLKNKMKTEITFALNTLPRDEEVLDYKPKQILLLSDSYRILFSERGGENLEITN
jgi:hypothetical protein